MGMIILPFLLLNFIIGIIAIVRVKNIYDIIGLNEIVFGILVSLAIFGLIAWRYVIKKKAVAFSPMLRIPFFMVLLPFIVSLSLGLIQHASLQYISTILLISVAASFILIVIFHKFAFGILGYLGVKKIY